MEKKYDKIMENNIIRKTLTKLQRISILSWLIILPVLFIIFWFLIPLIGIVLYSIKESTNVVSFNNYFIFFNDPFYITLLGKTFYLGFVVACFTTFLAYPVAYFVTRNRSRWKPLLLFIIMLPLVASSVVRTYGWFLILEIDGILNQLLIKLQLINSPLRLINNFWGVVIVLTHVLFPFSFLSIICSLKTVNPIFERAAQSLGANKFKTFLKVTLPLSLPGISAGFLLTFAEAIGSYSTPRLIGGYQFEIMSTMLYSNVMFFLNWPFSAAMAVILMGIVVAVMYIISKIVEIRESKIL